MALTLSLRLGEAFFAGGERLVLTKVLGNGWFVLTHVQSNGRGVTQHSDFRVGPKRGVAVLPEVMVSSGGDNSRRTARVLVQAPRSVEVIREKRHESGG